MEDYGREDDTPILGWETVHRVTYGGDTDQTDTMWLPGFGSLVRTRYKSGEHTAMTVVFVSGYPQDKEKAD